MSFLQSLSSYVIPPIRSAFDGAKRILSPTEGNEATVHVCAAEALWSSVQMRETSNPNPVLPEVTLQPAEREGIYQLLSPINLRMLSGQRQQILDIAMSIAPNKQESFIRVLLPLMTKAEYDDERLRILETVLRVFPDDWERFEPALPLLAHVYTYELEETLKTIRNIPPAELEPHTKLILPFITDESKGCWHIQELLRAMSRIKNFDKEIITQHLQIFNRSKPGINLLRIIVDNIELITARGAVDAVNISLILKILGTLLNHRNVGFDIIAGKIFYNLSTLSTRELQQYSNEIDNLSFHEYHDELRRFVSVWPPRLHIETDE